MIPSKDEQSALVHEASGGAEAAGRPATGDAGGGASIDKVRDLLFGGQLRELDRRFARLEERLVKETNQLRQDMQARIDALEAYARKESDSLGDQIRAEHQDRVDAHDNLARDLKERLGSVRQRLRRHFRRK